MPVQADKLEKYTHQLQGTNHQNRRWQRIHNRPQFGITKVALYDKPDEWINAIIIKGFG